MKALKLLIVLLVSFASSAQQNSESPYLSVPKGADIPLQKTKTDVQITGNIAYVHITQVYQNLGRKPIEAKYVFPMSTQAAVHKMDMSIGDRTLHAKIFEKKKAQVVYDKALKAGKRASKLDQERPNVFQMSVGNIMPKDEITIDIHYTELLVPTNGEYEFVAPGVVGPRFTGEATQQEKTFNQPYTKKGISDTFAYDIQVCLNAGMPLKKVTSNTHQINTNYVNPTQAEIFLSKSNMNPANRDFILKYNMRGDKINSGMLLYEGKDENFFAYLMEPPANVTKKDITAREYMFVLDVSGSMTGYPLDIAKKLLQNLLGDLRTNDSFNILLFAGGNQVFKQNPVVANQKNINEALQFLSGNFGGGGTRLLNALNTAYALPRVDKNSARSMVVITDGYISVEKQAFQIIKNNLNKANVFTFGIGSSVNRHLIEGMAKVSNSESFIATSETEAYEMATKFKKYIESPLLTQIKLEAKGFDIYDVEPSSISDVFASRPILIFGKYRGNAQGQLIVTGKQGSGNFKKVFNVSEGSLSKNNEALKYLWARKKIELLDDRNFATEDSKQQVTDLGIKYNLLTKYTSFVAVDNEVVNKKGTRKVVKQPLPMPRNVENSAIGAEASVQGSSVAKKSFSIVITGTQTVSKKQERALKIWLKANYSKLITDYLKKHQKLQIQLNSKGEISNVFTIENGLYRSNALLTKAFKKFSANLAPNNQRVSITLM